MKEKKNILIIVLLVVFVILSIYVLINKSNNILYIGSNTKIRIKNNEIKITNKNSKINLTKAKILFNNDFVDGYLKSSKSDINNKVNIYNAYNEDGKVLRFTDDLIAYVGKVNIKIAEPNILEIPLDKDLIIVENFLKTDLGNGITLDYSINYVDYKKVVYDIDKDGDNEYIYSLEVIEGETKSYTYIFIYDDEEYKLVDRRKGKITTADAKKISFFKLIDFNDDGKYELVLRLKNGDYGTNTYKIYEYNDVAKEIK